MLIRTNSEVYAAQVDRLYHQTPMVLTVNLVNSTLVAVVLASYSGETPWLIFLVVTVALTALRLIGWKQYYSRLQPGVKTTRWAILAIVGSGLSGGIWGVGSAMLLPGNLVEETFVAFVIGGMCVASLISFSNYFPAFVAYVFPAVLPMAGRPGNKLRIIWYPSTHTWRFWSSSPWFSQRPSPWGRYRM